MTNELFGISHGMNEMEYIPLRTLKNEKYNNMIQSLGLDIDKFYKVSNRLYPYCYSNETVFVEIYSMDADDFEKLGTKMIIEQREKYHKECIDTKDYRRLFAIIDKPFRLLWFTELHNEIPQEDRLDIFRAIYSSMEYGFENIDKAMMKELYNGYEFDKSDFDDVIIIYRGETEKSNHYTDVYSWTLDYGVAKWFSERFKSDGIVYKAKVNKVDILDYIDSNEKEILVFGENVFDVEEL